jgi:hypothetical protein
LTKKWLGLKESGNWTKAHLKSKIKTLKLNTHERGAIGSDGVQFHAVQSAISDFGFEMGFCPISQFPIALITQVY